MKNLICFGKKTVLLMIILVMATGLFAGCGSGKQDANVPSLESIAAEFNKQPYFEEFKNSDKMDFDVKAKADGDKIVLDVSAGETKNKFDILKNGNVLSVNSEEENFFSAYFYFMYIVDSANSAMGNEIGKTMEYLNKLPKDVSEDELFEKYGLKLDKEKFTASYDLTKKIEIEPIDGEEGESEKQTEEQTEKTPEDFIKLDDLKNFDMDGLMEQDPGTGRGYTVGDTHFDMFIVDSDEEDLLILVAAKKKINNNTYKSLITLIEKAFDSHKAADYFYAHFNKTRDKRFEGFKVEINPEKEEDEEFFLKDYDSFIRVTVDMNAAKKAIKNEKYNKTKSIEEIYDLIDSTIGDSSETTTKNSNMVVLKPTTVEEQKREMIVLALEIIGIVLVVILGAMLIFKISNGSLSLGRHRNSKPNVPVKRNASDENRFKRVMSGDTEKEEGIKEAELPEEELLEEPDFPEDIELPENKDDVLNINIDSSL